MRTAIPIALLLTTLAAAQTTRSGEHSGDDSELERAIAILRRLDGITASVNYIDMPLDEVIEDLNWFVDVPLTADWPALDVIGIDADSEVSLRLEDVPLATILGAITLQLGSDFDRPRVEVFKAGMLLLTSDEGTDRMRVTDVYDVRDLLADGRPIEELRQTAPSRIVDAEPETPSRPEETTTPDDDDEASTRPDWRLPERVGGDESAPDSVVRPRRAWTPGEELMTLVCEHVDPDAWIEFGGTRASISARNGVLMVSAAPTVHRSLRDALRRLRRAFSSLVAIRATIVDVPRAQYERLIRRYELSSAALGRAILAADEAHVLWSANGSAELGEALVFDSKGESAGVSLEFDTRLDRATGLLTIAVKGESRHGADERRVRTSVTIPYRNGGATIELPAATAVESVRVLVLIPARS